MLKKILITGANSYIGTSFEKYINKWHDEYQVDTVDMLDNIWRDKDFSQYDVVFHVAGIAHVKETKENKDLYYKVNRDLAYETASKAKESGVKQFIFLSSMSVYGIDTGIITKDTIPLPKSYYGKSKLEAEEKILTMQTDDYKIAILRPPMVYGKDCKGNFQSLIKLVHKMPVFPFIYNKRSMIYIDNLCEYVKALIDFESCGMFYPQNNEYMQTLNIVKIISAAINKKIYFSHLLGIIVRVSSIFIKPFKKAFGSLIYCDIEEFAHDYNIVSTENSIKDSI